MKRDIEVMRELLHKIEASDESNNAMMLDFQMTPETRAVLGVPPEDSTDASEQLNLKAYNLWLLLDGDYVRGSESGPTVVAHRITEKGCDFLEAIRDDNVLDQTKQTIGKDWPTASLDLVKRVGITIMTKAIEETLGSHLR